MALSDYVGAVSGVFNLLSAVPRSGQQVDLWAPSGTVVGDTPTEVGMRLTLGAVTYTVTNVVTPSGAVTGQQQWVGVRISPFAAAALTTAAAVTWEPYAVDSGAAPSSISVRRGESTTVDLRGWFRLVGTSFAAGRFTVTASGGAARLGVAGHTLTIQGVTAGTGETATVTFHSGALAVSVHTRINVDIANRAPTSTRAIGDVRVVPGQDPSWNLTDYFTDPDGDPLTFSARSSDPAVATVLPIDSPAPLAPSGERLTVDVSALGTATLTVIATDNRGLATAQQVHVAVTAGAPPVVTRHLVPVGLEFRGDSVSLDLASYFSDPDSGEPTFYCEFFSPPDDATGAPTADPWERLRWRVTGIRAGPRLVVRSRATSSSTPPWGSGAAWVLPSGSNIWYRGTWVGVRQTLRLTNTFDVRMSWNSVERAVEAVLLVNETLPSVGSSVQTQVQIGGLDVVWPVFGATDRSALTLEPGVVGRRTLYVGAFDASGQSASQLVTVSTSAAPVYSAIPDVIVSAGRDAPTVDLRRHFADPELGDMTFGSLSSDPNTARAAVVGNVLHVHGVRAGNTSVTVTATDPAGVSASGTFFVGVLAPLPVVPPILGTREAPTLIRDIFRTEGFEMLAHRSVSAPSPFTDGQWVFAVYPDPGTSSAVRLFRSGDTRVTLLSNATLPDFDPAARLTVGMRFRHGTTTIHRVTAVDPPVTGATAVVQTVTIDPGIAVAIRRDRPRYGVVSGVSGTPNYGTADVVAVFNDGPLWQGSTTTTLHRVAAARPVQAVRDFTDLSTYFTETRLYISEPVPPDFDTQVELQFTDSAGRATGNRWEIIELAGREHAGRPLYHEVLLRELDRAGPAS